MMRTLCALILLVLASPALAQSPVEQAASALLSGPKAGAEPLSYSLQVLLLMTLLSVVPTLLLMMTAFTRIIIVMSILRQALGLVQTPPNQVLVGLSLFLTFFIMSPVLDKVYVQAVQPYAQGTMTLQPALETGGAELRRFMLAQTRKKDIKLFADLGKQKPFATAADIPYSVLLPAFLTSELKTAFQIGFLIFLPFLIIDLVVSTVLMSLGMMMMSPTLISLPFKLLLFVSVDGWALTMGTLANSFQPVL
jgi:flagellar biosynthesis protein FliP